MHTKFPPWVLTVKSGFFHDFFMFCCTHVCTWDLFLDALFESICKQSKPVLASCQTLFILFQDLAKILKKNRFFFFLCKKNSVGIEAPWHDYMFLIVENVFIHHIWASNPLSHIFFAKKVFSHFFIFKMIFSWLGCTIGWTSSAPARVGIMGVAKIEVAEWISTY